MAKLITPISALSIFLFDVPQALSCADGSSCAVVDKPPPLPETSQPSQSLRPDDGPSPMSQREQYAEAKRPLEEINHELKTQPLTQAQRKLHAARLAGGLLQTKRVIRAALLGLIASIVVAAVTIMAEGGL